MEQSPSAPVHVTIDESGDDGESSYHGSVENSDNSLVQSDMDGELTDENAVESPSLNMRGQNTPSALKRFIRDHYWDLRRCLCSNPNPLDCLYYDSRLKTEFSRNNTLLYYLICVDCGGRNCFERAVFKSMENHEVGPITEGIIELQQVLSANEINFAEYLR